MMFSREFEQNRLEKYIYTFELSHAKKFLYSSFPKEESKLITEATLYYDYLKIYPIRQIIDKKIQRTGFDIDIITKDYMYYYGINNVRGGSYSNVIFTKSQEEVLHEEFNTFENADQKPKEYFITLLLEDYKDRLNTKEEVQKEIARITKQREQYNIDKERLDKFKIFSPWIYTFGDHMIHLRLQCSLYDIKCDSSNCHKDVYYDSVRYKELLKKIKIVYSFITENFPEIVEKKDAGDLVYCKYPEFIFDKFMYKHEGVGSLDSVNKICDLFIYFGDFLLNRMNEYEFDILSYGFEDDWTFSRRLHYLVNYQL